MSSNKRARFRSMFICTRSSWRSPFFSEQTPPPLPPPPLPPPLPLPVSNHTPVPSTDPGKSAILGPSCNATVPMLPSPPCPQTLVPVADVAGVLAAAVLMSRRRTLISVRINCCCESLIRTARKGGAISSNQNTLSAGRAKGTRLTKRKSLRQDRGGQRRHSVRVRPYGAFHARAYSDRHPAGDKLKGRPEDC